MKLIALILSLFIFTLAIIPCSDANTCDEDPSMELTHSHDHSDDEGDTCTAFCTCQCCGISITFSEIHQISLEQVKPTYTYSFDYLLLYSRDYLDRIWIPPSV